MSCKFPSLLKCFLFTLKQATTNLACAPFFCFAVFFYSFYYCWPYMEQLPDHLNVVAVDQDNSALSIRLTQAMRASPNLQVTQQTTSLPEAQNLMRKGGISAILIIPPNFETHTLTNVPTALVLVTNGAFIVKSRGSMSGVGGPLQKIVAASISAHLVEHGVPLSEIARAANNPPSMIVESMFNTVNGYLNFTVPIVFMIIFQTIFVCGIGMLMNDWFWKRKYPFPLALGARHPMYFLAMYAPFFFLSLFWILFIEGQSFSFHGVNSFKNVPGTIVVSMIYAFAITSLGMLIAALLKRYRFVVQIVVPSSIPFVFISGNLYPWQNIPWPLQAFGWLSPTTAGSVAMLRVSQAGATLSGVAFPYLTHLLLLGAAFLTAAYILIYKTQNDPQSLAEMEDLRKGIVDEKLAPELTPKQEKELTGKAV